MVPYCNISLQAKFGDTQFWVLYSILISLHVTLEGNS